MAKRPLIALCAVVVLSFPGTAFAAFCSSPTLVSIDIGHTPGRGGATSARGIPEYVFNKRLARFLAHSIHQVEVAEGEDPTLELRLAAILPAPTPDGQCDLLRQVFDIGG